MSDCNCPWDYADTQELLRNTAPINMTKEELDQHEKFEFLTHNVGHVFNSLAHQMGLHPLDPDLPKLATGTTIKLMNNVWRYKGKL
jgi:hypothetical protein